MATIDEILGNKPNTTEQPQGAATQPITEQTAPTEQPRGTIEPPKTQVVTEPLNNPKPLTDRMNEAVKKRKEMQEDEAAEIDQSKVAKTDPKTGFKYDKNGVNLTAKSEMDKKILKNQREEEKEDVLGNRIKAADEGIKRREAIENENVKRDLNNIEEKEVAEQTEEDKNQLEAEKLAKREKAEKIIAAIGDGLSSVANLYYTSKGALNSYNPDKSLQKAVANKWQKMSDQARADLMFQIQNAYHNRQIDLQEGKNNADAEDKKWARKFKEYQQHRKEYEWAVNQGNKTKAKELELQLKADKLGLDAALGKARNENYKARTKAMDNNKANAAIKRAIDGLRGKPITFSDGKGTKVNIWSRVWDGGSGIKVFNDLSKKMAGGDLKYYTEDENGKKTEKTQAQKEAIMEIRRCKTEEQKLSFVMAHWYEHPEIVEQMNGLAKDDPADILKGATGGYGADTNVGSAGNYGEYNDGHVVVEN